MKRIALIAILFASPAFAQQQPPADPALMKALSGTLRQQRDAYADQAAVAAAQLQIANEEIAALKAAAAKPLPPTPSPSPTKAP